MSKRKDLERARRFLYRGGERVSRTIWDRYMEDLRKNTEERRLKAMGLVVKGKPKLVTAERIGLEKVQKRVLTPQEMRDAKYR